MDFAMREASEVALNLMEGLSCPRSLTIAIMVRYEEWDQLLQLTAAPRDYLDSESFWAANAASEFFRKNRDVPTRTDPEAAAMETWWKSEKECFRTNLRLAPMVSSGLYSNTDQVPHGRVFEVISEARKNVINMIGIRPPDDLQGKFGPGATISDSSRCSTPADKLSSVPTLTPNALFHLVPWTGTEWAKAQAALGHEPQFVRGNHLFTVPKSALTRRSCGKEPSLNVFYQLAVGRELRQRLKRRYGLDLKEGQQSHRHLACSGSLTGDVGTIDLSSASDTVCYNLVKLLVPPEWFELLDSLRSPFTLVDGHWVKLEKFSSMGNGFTFELETLIFLSLALSIYKMGGHNGPVTVFGDDIIVPTSMCDDLVAALRYFGFTPNKRKTFVDGAFRESCGGDFFNGVPVRGYNTEVNPVSPDAWISLANGLIRTCADIPGRRRRVILAWKYCLKQLPSNVRRLRGPMALGDLVIHDVEDHWLTRWRNSIRYVKVYRPMSTLRVRWEGFPYCVQYATALYLAGTGGLSRDRDGDLIPRDSVTGFKVGWVAFS